VPLYRPRHTYAEYPQADPPSPVTCAVYVLVGLFIIATAIYILFRAGAL